MPPTTTLTSGNRPRTSLPASAEPPAAQPAATDEDFAHYVARRYQPLLRTACLLTGSRTDAEDLLQTALANTYLAWPRIRDRHAVDGYVRRVLVNTHRSLWRRRRVTELLSGQVPEPQWTTSSDAGTEQRDDLWQALAGLPPRQRATLVLRFYEDLSEAQTAEALGVSVGTVKSTTSRALQKLRHDRELRSD